MITNTLAAEANPFDFDPNESPAPVQPGRPAVTITVNPNGATEKQIAFIHKLAAERDLDLSGMKALTKREASTMIDKLLQIPKTPAPAPAPKATPKATGREAAEPGLYLMDHKIYKVQLAVHGSGRPYAKVLVIDRPEETDATGKIVRPGEGHFEMASGMVFKLKPEHRMTAEQAATFGSIYGMCCNCSKTLTDENSIHNGYGRVCAGKNGWPYEKAPAVQL